LPAGITALRYHGDLGTAKREASALEALEGLAHLRVAVDDLERPRLGLDTLVVTPGNGQRVEEPDVFQADLVKRRLDLSLQVRSRLVGDNDAGIWSAGQVQGLIHDIPTCAELIHRIVREAEHIIHDRLDRMASLRQMAKA